MPSYDLTLDDSSPLMRYEGFWVDASSNFSERSGYRDQTYHAADNVPGLTATLSFHGTQIIVYGNKSPRYDTFTVSVDGHESQVSAHSNTVTMSQPLFNSTQLVAGTHSIVIKSTGGSFDLDYVVITAGDGHPETQVTTSVLDERAKEFKWAGQWMTVTDSTYPSGSTMLTGSVGASYTLFFQGNGVQLFGSTYLDHGDYSVSVDGGPAEVFNGYFTQRDDHDWYLTTLYLASGLRDGSHQVTVRNLGKANRTFLDIDYAVVSSWSRPTGPSISTTAASAISSSDPSESTISSSKHSISPRTIAGIATGIGLLVITALLAVYLVCVRRPRRHRVHSTPLTRPVIPSPPSSPRIRHHHEYSVMPGTPMSDVGCSAPSTTLMSENTITPFTQQTMPLITSWSRPYADRKAARRGPLPEPSLPGYAP